MKDIVQSFRPDLFNGQHVLVSGGTSGIGMAIAAGFARLGASVTATGSSEARVASATPHAGVSYARLDVKDIAAVRAFVGKLASLNVLVNCQGIARPGSEWEEETFLEVMDVNLNSAMRLTMAALPLLRASEGNVINIASMLSYLVDDSVPAYCASKTGIMGLTRAQAHRFGPDGIRVNAIAPGYHQTDMTKPLWNDPVPAEKIRVKTALKRWGKVDDLVGMALFLASPAAGYVTATTIPVDGGYVVSGF